MKLILRTTDTDGCTYSADVYLGVEAESKEALGLQILEAIDAQCGPRIREAEELERSQTLTPPKRRKEINRGPFAAFVELNGVLVQVESDFHESDIMTFDEFFDDAQSRTKSHEEDARRWQESLRKHLA